MGTILLPPLSQSPFPVRNCAGLYFSAAIQIARRPHARRLVALVKHDGDQYVHWRRHTDHDLAYRYGPVPAGANADFVAGDIHRRLALLHSAPVRRYLLAEEEDWSLPDAALQGSSHYALPGVLRWFTANIGVHHVHHLSSRIPFYRLPQVLRDHPELADTGRLTLLESLKCVRLVLWDENCRRLISFNELSRQSS